MDKKISVEARIDLETIDEKLQNFFRARDEFIRAAYELKDAVGDDSFRVEISGAPLPDQNKAASYTANCAVV